MQGYSHGISIVTERSPGKLRISDLSRGIGIGSRMGGLSDGEEGLDAGDEIGDALHEHHPGIDPQKREDEEEVGDK